MANPVDTFIEGHRKLMVRPIFKHRFGISDSSRGILNYETGEMFVDSKGSLVGRIEEFSPTMNSLGINFSFFLSAVDGSFELLNGFRFLEFIKISSVFGVSPAYFLLRRKISGNVAEGYYEGVWAFPGEDFSRISKMPKDEKRLLLKGVGAEYVSMNLFTGKQYTGE